MNGIFSGNVYSDTHMTILRDGNIGIGVTEPSEKLEVNGNSIINNMLIGDMGLGSTLTGIRHISLTVSGQYGFLQQSTGATMINSENAEPIYFRNKKCRFNDIIIKW